MVKQKIVFKVSMNCQKCQTKALQIAAQTKGVESVGVEGEDSDARKEHVFVIGDGIDVATLGTSLRKKVGHTDVVSVIAIEDDDDD